MAPLGPYADISYNDFVNTNITGLLVNVNSSTVGEVTKGTIAYVSCDPPPPQALDTNDLLQAAIASANAGYIILYTETSHHCRGVNLTKYPAVDGIFTIIGDPSAAYDLAISINSSESVGIVPDLTSYTVHSSGSSVPSATSGPSANPALAHQAQAPASVLVRLLAA